MARKSKQQQQQQQQSQQVPDPPKVQPTAETVRATSSRQQSQREPRRMGKASLALTSPLTSKAYCLVAMAALSAPLSQLALAPVYGSLPAAVYHRYGLIAASLLAFLLRGLLPTWMERVIPSLAFWIPSIQLGLFTVSSRLGNPLGPLVTELLTCYPLVTLSLFVAQRTVEGVDLRFLGSRTVEEVVPSMVLQVLFLVFERVFRGALPYWVGLNYLTSRVGLQMVVGGMYGLLLPKSLFWPAVPSILITTSLNVHNPMLRTTGMAKNALALHQYSLLERKESVTGYLAVLEDDVKKFRVLRCDHSLLGGQWLDAPPKGVDRKVAEPIYAVFTMMEAVRLVEPPKAQVSSKNKDEQKRALNIGLGVGTAPSALIAHGVNTTVVELDPVVHDMAVTYFGLPKSHLYWIGDAVDFVDQRSADTTRDKQYDYILHDVFTGGAVPTSLFTSEFLTGLLKLLRPDGTIAINYAGDLNLPSASLIHRTISATFPNCRIFREEPESQPKEEEDFTNLVYFCTHPNNKQPIKFRKAVVADFLGSRVRQQYLLPKHEVNAAEKFRGDVGVVSKGSQALRELEKWQVKSALGHWHLMRTVIPDGVWENW